MSNVLPAPYFQLPTPVVTTGQLANMTAGELKLYVYLLCEAQRYSNPELPPFRTVALESQTGLASGTLTVARQALAEKGLIALQGGQGRPYTYTICNPVTGEPLMRATAKQRAEATQEDGQSDNYFERRYARAKSLNELTPEQYKKFYCHHLQLFYSSQNQASARCPFHDDSRPSLSVELSKGIWNCHACGQSGGVLAFQKKIANCDPGPALAQIAEIVGDPSIARRVHDHGALEREYTYVDEYGEILFAIERYEGKQFLQKRPNGSGWVHNLNGVRRVLYRLPQVLAASHVIITEGEKDADAVDALGLRAPDGTRYAVTTNPGGAGKWKDEYSTVLRGKKIMLLYDCDAPGMAHADEVRGSIERECGVSPEFVGFGEFGAKDVSDFLNNHSRDELIEALGSSNFQAAAPEWVEP